MQTQYPESRIALIWDGALRVRADRRLTTTRRLTPSHHRSGEVKNYLDSVNQGFECHEWKITCIRFAPNAPEQNPIEDVWLSAKRFVREFYSLCSSFAIAKRLFELATDCQIFDFPKLSLYGSFS